ncbi:MAG: SUMF1/EgtB/PvdO family nonheme iron enzyme [Prevotella sp.]|nr:SUMF1/EgtB/PvdO family nonheme iron enzyme [Prevotella sp.]
MELKNGTALKGGEYVIKRKLGQGGMGITYLASTPVVVKRGLGSLSTTIDVVVKEFFIGTCCDRASDGRTMTVITNKFDETVERGLKKFRKEAGNLQKMEHENIVNVIDLFSENQTEYIVMDYLPGGSLQEYVDKHGPLSAADAVKRISEVAGALWYMHQRKLCHFDVKPGNVMLGPNGQAVLIDFGLSKHYRQDDLQSSSVLFMGTSEGYAPLEQSNDSVELFSPQTDVYALGATLYFLLTGKRPGKASFNINNVLPKERPDAIPENLWQLIRNCMKAVPYDRPGDAGEFLHLLTGEKPKETPPPPKPPRGEDTLVFGEEEKKKEKESFPPPPPPPPPVRKDPKETVLSPDVLEGRVYSPKLMQQKAVTQGVETFTVNGVSFNMVFVEGGTFMMGATTDQEGDVWADEKPFHQVTLSSYKIGETEVTQELWEAVMGSNPSHFKGKKFPVENVSWEDCQYFIDYLNRLTGKHFRFPTEAEWEFAARGGNKSRHTKYAGSNDIDEVAWYWDNSGQKKWYGLKDKKTHEVATKQPNELGLYDMSGNVWEWCQDWYGDYSSSAQTAPTGPSSGSYRVLRGGSWHFDARACRVAARGSNTPSDRDYYLGLRLAF